MDPIHEVQDLLDLWKKEKNMHIWHHVDAAYGGFFRSMDFLNTQHLSVRGKAALSALPRVDSVTLDPHKLGYVPYASGTFLVKNKRDYYFKAFEDAPYIDFDPSTDRGPYTIEGSRSAAGAAATWMASKTMGLNNQGYGLLLERTIRICAELKKNLQKSNLTIRISPGCDTNIICFLSARQGEKISETNQRSLKIYERFSPKNNSSFIVSKTTFRWSSYELFLNEWVNDWSADRDVDELVVIRMCMMNPFFETKESSLNYMQLFVDELKSVVTL